MPRPKSTDKNIILFVNDAPSGTIDAVKKYSTKTKEPLKTAVIYDSKQKFPHRAQSESLSAFDFRIPVNLNSNAATQKALLPYNNNLLAITCRSEHNIPNFKEIIPHVPYIRTPTAESLEWTTNKIMMRQRLFTHSKKISPAYMVATDYDVTTLHKIEKQVGFPLIVKPSGLAASLLVSICYHREELETVLRKTFKKIAKVYKEQKGRGSPKVLVEQFMEGEMYSVDAYVGSRGKAYFCPLVHVKTGRAIGFDDFFGYQRLTPTLLNKRSIEKAEMVASEGIKALGLRSVTCHVELMRTEKGWKVIEIGPRIGGFRNVMYKLSHGIDHTLNDIMIRIPRNVNLPKKRLGYAAALQFFAHREGRLKKLSGIKKARSLDSFKSIDLHKKVGDRCLFAKHGGKSVFDIVLFNSERSLLLADIRRLEQHVKIET